MCRIKVSLRTVQSTLSASVIKTENLILYRETIVLCSELYKKNTNLHCGQNTEFLSVKPGGTYSNY